MDGLAQRLADELARHQDRIEQVREPLDSLPLNETSPAGMFRATWRMSCTCGWQHGVYDGPAALLMLEARIRRQREHVARALAEIAEEHARRRVAEELETAASQAQDRLDWWHHGGGQARQR